MALDIQFHAERFEPIVLLKSVDQVLDRGWATITSQDTAITLVRANSSTSSYLGNQSIYARLEAAGVVCVAGRPEGGEVRLNGGSVSACSLRLGDSPVVVKRVSRSVLGEIDARQRHSQEARWTAEINKRHETLFPEVLAIRSDAEVEVRSRFFPAYTLGELLLQERVSGEEALSLIRRVFAAIRLNLSSLKFPNPGESYTAKVRRRLGLILRTNSTPIIDLLCRTGAVIDGVAYPSALETIARIERDAYLDSLVRCGDPRHCHGDLIPEDIVCSASLGQFRLIDPNPQVKDPLADAAKLVMSLSLYYELALRNQTSVHWTHAHSLPHVETMIESAPANYIRASDWLRAAIIADVGALLECSVEAHRLKREAVLLMAGLQSMAISAFHLLHHRKPDRAAYFLSRGLAMTNAAIASS